MGRDPGTDDRTSALPGSGPSGAARWPFLRTPLACRAWITTTVLAALVVPILLDHRIGHRHTAHGALTALAIVTMSVLNIEIGRLLEGGAAHDQRPHKALSTWSFTSALVLSIGWLLPVVALCYAHARWRGLKVPLWKWIGSAAYVVLAGVVAAVTAQLVLDGQDSLTHGNGLRGMLAVIAAATAFLGTETLLFHGSAYLNDAADETWLRQTLAHRSFYLTEAGVVLVGGLAAALWNGGAWFLVLLLPIFVLAQRAALHEPLRLRAEQDDKTGLLRFESWHRAARLGATDCNAKGQPWSVVFVDLDHFKDFNDTWGHLAGDLALVSVADAIRHEVRAADVVARFGGEEFCVFLPRTDLVEADRIAERIRQAVERADLPGEQVLSISAGVAAPPPGERGLDIDVVLLAADSALYLAKSSGRNATRACHAGPHHQLGTDAARGR